MMAAAWVINLAVAEWVIRRPAARRATPCRHGALAGSPMTARPPERPRRTSCGVRGHLDRHWSTWFDGFTVTAENDGTTTLRGVVTDQAELHGLLAKVRDLGTTLISVIPLGTIDADEHPRAEEANAHPHIHSAHDRD